MDCRRSWHDLDDISAPSQLCRNANSNALTCMRVTLTCSILQHPLVMSQLEELYTVHPSCCRSTKPSDVRSSGTRGEDAKYHRIPILLLSTIACSRHIYIYMIHIPLFINQPRPVVGQVVYDGALKDHRFQTSCASCSTSSKSSFGVFVGGPHLC